MIRWILPLYSRHHHHHRKGGHKILCFRSILPFFFRTEPQNKTKEVNSELTENTDSNFSIGEFYKGHSRRATFVALRGQPSKPRTWPYAVRGLNTQIGEKKHRNLIYIRVVMFHTLNILT